jgi:hypothetical protein
MFFFLSKIPEALRLRTDNEIGFPVSCIWTVKDDGNPEGSRIQQNSIESHIVSAIGGILANMPIMLPQTAYRVKPVGFERFRWWEPLHDAEPAWPTFRTMMDHDVGLQQITVSCYVRCNYNSNLASGNVDGHPQGYTLYNMDALMPSTFVRRFVRQGDDMGPITVSIGNWMGTCNQGEEPEVGYPMFFEYKVEELEAQGKFSSYELLEPESAGILAQDAYGNPSFPSAISGQFAKHPATYESGKIETASGYTIQLVFYMLTSAQKQNVISSSIMRFLYVHVKSFAERRRQKAQEAIFGIVKKVEEGVLDPAVYNGIEGFLHDLELDQAIAIAPVELRIWPKSWSMSYAKFGWEQLKPTLVASVAGDRFSFVEAGADETGLFMVLDVVLTSDEARGDWAAAPEPTFDWVRKTLFGEGDFGNANQLAFADAVFRFGTLGYSPVERVVGRQRGLAIEGCGNGERAGIKPTEGIDEPGEGLTDRDHFQREHTTNIYEGTSSSLAQKSWERFLRALIAIDGGTSYLRGDDDVYNERRWTTAASNPGTSWRPLRKPGTWNISSVAERRIVKNARDISPAEVGNVIIGDGTPEKDQARTARQRPSAVIARRSNAWLLVRLRKLWEQISSVSSNPVDEYFDAYEVLRHDATGSRLRLQHGGLHGASARGISDHYTEQPEYEIPGIHDSDLTEPSQRIATSGTRGGHALYLERKKNALGTRRKGGYGTADQCSLSIAKTSLASPCSISGS